jgi:hypothetical protein
VYARERDLESGPESELTLDEALTRSEFFDSLEFAGIEFREVIT